MVTTEIHFIGIQVILRYRVDHGGTMKCSSERDVVRGGTSGLEREFSLKRRRIKRKIVHAIASNTTKCWAAV